MNVYLYPFFRGTDNGDGGVRRVVDAQKQHLPQLGVTVVDTPEEADIIACHMTAPHDFYKKYATKLFVSHCHGLYWSEYAWVEKWFAGANQDVMETCRNADLVTAPSEWVANALRRALSRPVEVIHHGVDTEEWAVEPELTRQDYILWNKTRPDPVCDPGPVSELAEMLPHRQFMTTFGKNLPNMHILGSMPYEEGKRYVKQAGIYLATTRETFGIGTLEAMAAGVPVVGWNWGGQREIITPGVDGILTAPLDIAGLAAGIEEAFTRWDELSAAGRKTAGEFTWERATARYAELYEQVFAGRRYSGWSATAPVQTSTSEELVVDEQSERPRPTVSVIVTAYNLDRYLEACLTSVYNQTFTNWECIIVDDASPDRCGEIADSGISSLGGRGVGT